MVFTIVLDWVSWVGERQRADLTLLVPADI